MRPSLKRLAAVALDDYDSDENDVSVVPDTSDADSRSEGGNQRTMVGRGASSNLAAIRWCATLNQPSAYEMMELFDKLKEVTTFQIWGHEGLAVGRTEHWQGFVKFKKPIRLSGLKKLSTRAHWERTWSNDQTNIAYCSKEDPNPLQSGIRPLFTDNGERERHRWDEIWTNASENRIMAIPAQVRVTSYPNIRAIAKDFMVKPNDLPDVCGEWLYGVAGAGKSWTARNENPSAYFKNATIWWDGYQNEPAVILDDVDKYHVKLGYHLKIWADRYSFVAETKGSALHIRPLKFIVTSQYQIEDIWDDVETRVALNRRFKQRRIGALPPFPIFVQPTPTRLIEDNDEGEEETGMGLIEQVTPSDSGLRHRALAPE